MNVSLTLELEQMVNERLATGLYQSANEVIHEALRLLQERDQLRSEILLGAEQLKQGRYKEYDSVDELIDDIRTRGQARLANNSRTKSHEKGQAI